MLKLVYKRWTADISMEDKSAAIFGMAKQIIKETLVHYNYKNRDFKSLLTRLKANKRKIKRFNCKK
jgi:hypothetical protein